MRLPSFAELRKFCEVEGWEDKDEAAGKKKGDHHRYTLRLDTGDVLYTRVSHGRGQIGDPNLWRNVILKHQLQVTEEQFWACADGGVKPPRPAPEKPVERAGLPAKLAANLLRKVDVTPDQLATMTKDEAVQAWNDYLSGGGT